MGRSCQRAPVPTPQTALSNGRDEGKAALQRSDIRLLLPVGLGRSSIMSVENRSCIAGLSLKLGRHHALDSDDLDGLSSLQIQVEQVQRSKSLILEGDTPERCCLLMRGYAAGYKDASSGSRQIIAFHLAGDLLNIPHLLLSRADHSIEAITPARVGWIAKSQLISLITERPKIGRALWRDSLIEGAIAREWALNIGQRDAKTRIAHLICEFVIRSEAAGLGNRHSFELPFTQLQIADATGLTAVHVNRTLRTLDGDGAIVRRRNQFRVLDWDRLRDLADFDPAYLHLNR